MFQLYHRYVFRYNVSGKTIFCLARMDITKKRTGHRQDLEQIHSYLQIFFVERLSDPLHFPSSTDQVIKGTYCYVVLTPPVNTSHTTPVSFIDKTNLLLHWNMNPASICHNLSSIIIVK